MNLVNKTAVTLAVGAVVIGSSLASTAQASAFGFSEMQAGYQLIEGEGKCGEGKCGAEEAADKVKEGKCGEGKCGADKAVDKVKEAKCGEGKCGGDKAKAKVDAKVKTEGKCGEGKCGGSK
ncbi:HvfA family oxazolone/thioamide-modified RiPP metallophore [Shewanella youngdeokensis]|uniref:Low-complexity protein n=1 Tax=Shewanella youngdeokensis TaxID=2999068 RepID=A0ABZ0K3M5_9GAMM|nr:hypothetical protein RGE70_06510 [Shewanella sp. DAU334]